ncbi:carbohydrate ABC transporter permease [Paenibacillus eucommiae]|uniref:Multiple sugar transport system permease protein n=1 Tax=Paenibacillus eucommiae TaxID=1355755 RepID=A0ABS4J0Z9_9BACL|nr:carbohydrate ABC transporter permease [Paenibacillus eucommiae]MBP1992459.1 multiple sugar transport system permease protein [Paenibacillus eucommiae]
MESKNLSVPENVLRVIGLVMITVIAIVAIMPLYWMITGSFKIQLSAMSVPPEWFPAMPTLENYKDLFTDKPTLRWLFNSLFTAGCISLGAIITSTMAGYAFGKKQFVGKKFLFWLMLGTMMLPHQVLLIPLFLMITKLDWINSYAGLIVPFLAYPLGVFLVKQYMQSVPNELLEAARIDGANEIRTFTMVVVPMAKPAIGAIGIFSFVAGWNEYLWQLVISDKEHMLTLPVAVSRLSQGLGATNLGLAMAGATVAFIPMLIFFIVFQRFFVKGISVGALKG